MPIYKQTTEITKIDDVWANIDRDIVEVYFGDKNIFTVWGEYDSSLPITITANGDVLIDYRIYGASGGVGEPTENLFDESTAESGGYIDPDSGDFVSNAAWSSSDYVKVTGNYINLSAKLIAYLGGWAMVHNFYDSNKSWLGGDHTVQGNGTIGGRKSKSYSISGVSYVRVSYRPVIFDDIMMVEGSTAPASYIPYGYKLPMTVYKQEFEVTSDMIDQSNWTLSPPYGGYKQRFFMYFDISASISKEECDAKVYKNFTDGYVPGKLVVSLTDDIYPNVDISYRILNNYGVILNKEFDFSSWDKIYLCIGYGDGFSTEEDKQLKIDELFGNWKILIAPTSQTREAPVYIGENQLEENEYVSFSEQKIYRDVSGALTPTDPPVPFPEIPTIEGETIIDYDGSPKPSQMYVKYRKQHS